MTVDQLVTCSNQVDGNSVTSGSQGLIAHVFFGVIAQWQSERLQFVWSGVRLTLAPLAETLWIMRGQEFDSPIGCKPISTVEAALNPLTMVSFRQLSNSEMS